MEREQALELLNEQHTFPGPFLFRVIVIPDARVPAIEALTLAVGIDPTEVIENWSRTRKYCALRITFELPSAELVLAGFAAIETVEGMRLQM